MWEIYLAVSPSGTPYIGQTKVGISKRLAKHSKDAASGSDLPFHRAIAKYGLDAFSVSTAAICFTKTDADVFERALISVYRKQGPTYNIADGGQGGGAHRKPHTEETKQKISQIKRGCKGAHPKGVSLPKATLEASAIVRRKQVVHVATQQEFNSVQEAADAFNLSKSGVSRVCLGKRKQIYGHVFKFKEDVPSQQA